MYFVTIFSREKISKLDTSLFVQKLYFASIFIKGKVKEDINMQRKFRLKNLFCLVDYTDAVCKSYVNSGLYHPSVLRNTAHADFTVINLNNVRLAKV